MTENKFNLRCNDFETNMTTALKDLRNEKDFFDVTIACEDNQIQAHKVILSACSTFFRNLLRRNPHQHPLLYLKGVKYKELLGILDFMYNGEVNISQEELKQFLAIAADLKVQGLTQKMAIPTTDPIIPSKSTVTTSTPLPTRVNSQKRESAEKEPPKKRLRPSPTTPAKPIATPTRAIATPTKPITTPTRAYQQVDNNEILEVVSTQSVLKASPTLNNSPKVYRPQPPRKPIQDTTPAPQILEQCILEAEIDTNEEARRGAEVAQERNKKTPAMTPTRGYEKEKKIVKLNLENLSKFPETMIDLEPKNVLQEIGTFVQEEVIIASTPREASDAKLDMIQEVSSEVYYVTEIEPEKVSLRKPGKRGARKTRTPKKPPTLDLSFIERFATVWRCKICQKISSNKFLAIDHREEAHAVAMQLK